MLGRINKVKVYPELQQAEQHRPTDHRPVNFQRLTQHKRQDEHADRSHDEPIGHRPCRGHRAQLIADDEPG